MKKILLATSLLLTLTACGTDAVTSRPSKGNPNAFVQIVEFGDLQCPACAAAHSRVVGPLLTTYGNQIGFTYKHFPLANIHQYARNAAIASECAADQGKFWEFVDIAFLNQSDLNNDTIDVWAESLSLDTDAFSDCLGDRGKRAIVDADYEEGRDLGVNSTPTFFVNGKKFPGSLEQISQEIDRLLGSNMAL